MESVCPTCESVIDPTRAPVARIVGSRVITFCSSDCAEGKPAAPAPAPATKAKAEAKATSLPPARPAARTDPGSAVSAPPSAPQPEPEPSVVLKGKRRNRGVILAASAVLLAGVAVVLLEAWPSPASVTAETLASADDAPQAGEAATTGAVAEVAPAARQEEPDGPIDPKRLYDKAYAELRALLGSESPRIQRIAAMALARARDEQALEMLRGLLDHEDSPLVEVQIAYALARAGDDRGREALVKALRKKQRDVKLDAARSLVRLGDDAGADQLRGMLSYKHYRIGAAGLLARLGDERGFQALRSTRDDRRSSHELKMRATVALGRAGDESVRAELTGILDDGRYQVGAADALAALGDSAAVSALTHQLDIDAFRVQAALGLRRMEVDVDLAPLASALHTGNEVVRVTAGEAVLVLTGPKELAGARLMARDLRLFYLFRLLATSYLWAPIFVFFMASRGLGFDEVMLLSVAYSVVVMLVEVPTGAFADRIGRRQSMMVGALAMTASCLIAYNAYSFQVFLAAEVLAAISMALCSGADSAYLFDLLQDNGRGHEYPRREGHASAFHLAGSMGACLAGGLLGSVDLGLPYLINAGTAAVAFVVALFMREETPSGKKRQRRALTAELGAYVGLMGRSFGVVARNKRLAWIVFYSAVVFALLRVTVYLYQPYLDARGFSIWQTGVVFAGIYAVAAIAALRADAVRRVVGESVMIWGLLGTLAVSFLLLHVSAGPLAIALLAVQATTKGLYSPLVKPILNREISDSGRRATVLSVESIARRSATGLASLVAAGYGAYSAIYLCGALGMAGFGLLAVASRWAPGRAHSPPLPLTEVEHAPVPVEVTVD